MPVAMKRKSIPVFKVVIESDRCIVMVLIVDHLFPHAVLHLVEVLRHPAGKVARGCHVVPRQVLARLII